MMQETESDTAVSNIIGTIILFGFVVALLVVFQVTAVPVWNQNTEFEHSQRVQGDIGKLHDNIVLSGTTGRSTTQSVELGTQYTRRALFINPTDPSGSVSTLEPGDVTLRNVESGDSDVGDYWNGTDPQEFDTRAFRYQPDYNEFANAPSVFMDNMVLYNQVGDNQARLTAQNVVSDRNINLNLLTGNLSRSGVRPTSVNIDPVSAPSEVISVSNSTGGQVEIELPTNLREDRWRDALTNERVENGGHVETVSYTENADTYNTLTLGLESGVGYNLRMSKVALGERDESQEAHYIVNRGNDDISVTTGGTERIEVEVRDRYNNPISGVNVDTEIQPPTPGDDPGELVPVQPRTDAEGVASFEYRATGDAPTAGMKFSILEDSTARERVNVAVNILEEGTGGSAGDREELDQGGQSDVFVSSVDRLSGGSSNEANVRFRNEGGDKQITGAKFVFFYDSRNCPCADRLRIGNTNPVLEAAGDMEDLNTPIDLPAGGTETVNFDFRTTGSGGGFSVRGEDFAVVRLEFDNGASTSTYFIQFQSN